MYQRHLSNNTNYVNKPRAISRTPRPALIRRKTQSQHLLAEASGLITLLRIFPRPKYLHLYHEPTPTTYLAFARSRSVGKLLGPLR
jgi:hypothetical protein